MDLAPWANVRRVIVVGPGAAGVTVGSTDGHGRRARLHGRARTGCRRLRLQFPKRFVGSACCRQSEGVHPRSPRSMRAPTRSSTRRWPGGSSTDGIGRCRISSRSPLHDAGGTCLGPNYRSLRPRAKLPVAREILLDTTGFPCRRGERLRTPSAPDICDGNNVKIRLKNDDTTPFLY